jgi:hypothetical protein
MKTLFKSILLRLSLKDDSRSAGQEIPLPLLLLLNAKAYNRLPENLSPEPVLSQFSPQLHAMFL